MSLQALAPLDTAPYFAPLHGALISMLRSLQPADWDRPTVAGSWRVRDVAAHLLDGDLRKLAAHRDGHSLAVANPPRNYAEVVTLIQQLNAGGVAFGARLSARLLTDLLEVSGRWTSDFVAALDPEALALFPVAWAGETQSTNRFDTAREFTERWHHQMQIRDAVGAHAESANLLTPTFLMPLLATSVRALPHAYRAVPAEDGTTVTLQLEGDHPMAWTLLRENGSWQLYEGEVPSPTAHVQAAPDAWWRLFFNALSERTTTNLFTVRGPEDLVTPLWRARAVMV